MQTTDKSLTSLKNGISILPEYRALKADAMTYADLKVNLAIRNNRAYVHVAGSEAEYIDLGAARAYVHRVEDTIAGSIITEEAVLS